MSVLRNLVVLSAVVLCQGEGRLALFQGASAAEPPPAAVGTAPASNDDEAQRLADQAVAAYEKGDYPNAATLFKQAHALRADPTLLYNLAKIYEKMNDPQQAVEYYRRYLVADSTDAKLRARAETRVRVLSETTGVRDSGPTTPPVKRKAAAPGGTLLWSGVAVAAVGVAGLAVGIGLDAASSSEYSTFSGTVDELDKRASRDRAQSLSTGALAGYVVGGVLLAGGGTLIGLGLKKRFGAESRAAHSSLSVPVLVPLPGGGVAAIGGRF